MSAASLADFLAAFLSWLVDEGLLIPADANDGRDQANLLADFFALEAQQDCCGECRCGHQDHLHDRESVPALCMACGSGELCTQDLRCRPGDTFPCSAPMPHCDHLHSPNADSPNVYRCAGDETDTRFVVRRDCCYSEFQVRHLLALRES